MKNEEKKYSRFDIIELLVGPYQPTADAAEDRVRLHNLKALGDLFKQMHLAINDVAYGYVGIEDYESVKDLVKEANRILDEVGITNNLLGQYEPDMLERISIDAYPDQPDLAKAYREGFIERCKEEVDANL